MAIVRARTTTVASVVGRALEASTITVTDYVVVENWRRPPDCDCPGCHEGGRCQNAFLAWTDRVALNTRPGPLGLGLIATLAIVALIHLPLVSVAAGIAALVTTAGKNDLLTQYFKGAAYTATWYIGLVDGASTPTFVVTDTMASHPGWTENVAYSNASRVTWTGGTVAAGSVDNSASPAAFSINAAATVAGLFMVNNSAKSGTTGTLYSQGAFTQGNRSVQSGDTLSCTATQTVS